MATTYNIEMNRYNGTDYDKLLPQGRPIAHAATHASGGSDPITPSSIGAATVKAPVIVTVPTSGWTQNGTYWQQSVAVSGLLATDDYRTRIEPVGNANPATQAITDASYAMIDYAACNTNGQLYLRSPNGKPPSDFQIAVVIIR